MCWQQIGGYTQLIVKITLNDGLVYKLNNNTDFDRYTINDTVIRFYSQSNGDKAIFPLRNVMSIIFE